MPAQIDRFSEVPGSGVSPDRGLSDGRVSAITPQRGPRSAHIAIQYNRRGTSQTGEQDGAKEANGG